MDDVQSDDSEGGRGGEELENVEDFEEEDEECHPLMNAVVSNWASPL